MLPTNIDVTNVKGWTGSKEGRTFPSIIEYPLSISQTNKSIFSLLCHLQNYHKTLVEKRNEERRKEERISQVIEKRKGRKYKTFSLSPTRVPTSKQSKKVTTNFHLISGLKPYREKINIMFLRVASSIVVVALLFSASAVVVVTTAFQQLIIPTKRPLLLSSTTSTTSSCLQMSDLFGEYDLDMEVPPDECNIVDVQRAQECIMNPEGCTVEEIQSLKKGT